MDFIFTTTKSIKALNKTQFNFFKTSRKSFLSYLPVSCVQLFFILKVQW